MMYCALNDCECYPWDCIAVISITMNVSKTVRMLLK